MTKLTKISEIIHDDPETAVSLQAQMEVIEKLDKDLREAALHLTDREARFLVDSYYAIQESRIRTSNRVSALKRSGSEEPWILIGWLHRNSLAIERNVARMMDIYSVQTPLGRWSRRVPGIGPVLAAGLLAHVDIQKCHYVGQLYSFAGLDPDAVWKAKERRPWNASLKNICWKIGESFTRVSTRPEDYYGQIYKVRKKLEEERNDRGEHAEVAAQRLKRQPDMDKTTPMYKAYAAGRLPQARVHLRAQRYAVKFFLSHWHHVAHVCEYGEEPPVPWIIAHDPRHNHLVKPPFMD